ncbi:hypothetical protein [Lactiplantibacillus carotarum]|uniref:hypothetical protein n=1 Tax=Lactiplantibacillus carotarum TaxID=2993456 RepID=UPI00298F0336|nr:hypothetical protein [Lactiplantibacillus carotarum]
MEFENVREALRNLLDYNDSKVNSNLETRIDKGPWRKCTAKDVQEFNYEIAVNIADQLGMSDLYLGNQHH